MIDLHCHILPGYDDGPEDLEGSIALARGHVAAGVATVAATPHVQHQLPGDPADLARRRAEVQAALDEQGIDLRIVAGGEVALTLATDLSPEALAGFALGGGEWVLVEPPISTVVYGLESMMGMLQAHGRRVLIAHPERCQTFHHDPDVLERLVRGGALAQGTATALTGSFGRTVQRLLKRYVDDGLIHVFASDAHDAVNRPPGLREPLEEAGLGELVDWACTDVPAAILDGTDVPRRPHVAPPAPRRRFWRRG